MQHAQIEPASVRIWGRDYPVSVSQDGDWWDARPDGYDGFYGASSRISAAEAANALARQTAWHGERG